MNVYNVIFFTTDWILIKEKEIKLTYELANKQISKIIGEYNE